RPCGLRPGAVLGQALLEQVRRVVLGIALAFPDAEQHLLLAGLQGVPRLGRHLVGRDQRVLEILLLLLGAARLRLTWLISLLVHDPRRVGGPSGWLAQAETCLGLTPRH